MILFLYMISLGNIYSKTDKNNNEAPNGTKPPKGNLLILLVSLGVLVILAIFLALVFKNESKNETNNLPTTIQTEEVLLNPEEVEAERLLLPSYKAVDSTPSSSQTNLMGTASTGSGTANILPEGELSGIINTKAEGQTQGRTQIEGQKITISQPASPTAKVESSSNVYVEPGSGIEVKNISVTYANAERNLSGQERKGTLQTINLAENYLLIVDSGNITKIDITPQTSVFINSKKIAVANLLLGDVLLIEGSGYTDVTELTANSIKIIAKLQLISDPN